VDAGARSKGVSEHPSTPLLLGPGCEVQRVHLERCSSFENCSPELRRKFRHFKLEMNFFIENILGRVLIVFREGFGRRGGAH